MVNTASVIPAKHQHVSVVIVSMFCIMTLAFTVAQSITEAN